MCVPGILRHFRNLCIQKMGGGGQIFSKYAMISAHFGT